MKRTVALLALCLLLLTCCSCSGDKYPFPTGKEALKEVIYIVEEEKAIQLSNEYKTEMEKFIEDHQFDLQVNIDKVAFIEKLGYYRLLYHIISDDVVSSSIIITPSENYGADISTHIELKSDEIPKAAYDIMACSIYPFCEDVNEVMDRVYDGSTEYLNEDYTLWFSYTDFSSIKSLDLLVFPGDAARIAVGLIDELSSSSTTP